VTDNLSGVDHSTFPNQLTRKGTLDADNEIDQKITFNYNSGSFTGNILNLTQYDFKEIVESSISSRISDDVKDIVGNSSIKVSGNPSPVLGAGEESSGMSTNSYNDDGFNTKASLGDLIRIIDGLIIAGEVTKDFIEKNCDDIRDPKKYQNYISGAKDYEIGSGKPFIGNFSLRLCNISFLFGAEYKVSISPHIISRGRKIDLHKETKFISFKKYIGEELGKNIYWFGSLREKTQDYDEYAMTSSAGRYATYNTFKEFYEKHKDKANQVFAGPPFATGTTLDSAQQENNFPLFYEVVVKLSNKNGTFIRNIPLLMYKVTLINRNPKYNYKFQCKNGQYNRDTGECNSNINTRWDITSNKIFDGTRRIYQPISDERKYHIRERHDVSFLTGYQFIYAYLYKSPHSNIPMPNNIKDPKERLNLEKVKIVNGQQTFTGTVDKQKIMDNKLVSFEGKKQKGKSWSESTMRNDESREKLFNLAEDVADMTDVYDSWVEIVDPATYAENDLLQIRRKEKSGRVIDVTIGKNNWKFASAFPDKTSSIDIGDINKVKDYFKTISTDKLEEDFVDSLKWSFHNNLKSSARSDLASFYNNGSQLYYDNGIKIVSKDNNELAIFKKPSKYLVKDKDYEVNQNDLKLEKY
jgi:hypothetical protein